MKKTIYDRKKCEILNDINHILGETITVCEQDILKKTKVQLEKNEYFPKIIKDLEIELTHLAIQKKLSKNVGELYLKITSSRFKNKGFGYGLMTVFGINH